MNNNNNKCHNYFQINIFKKKRKNERQNFRSMLIIIYQKLNFIFIYIISMLVNQFKY